MVTQRSRSHESKHRTGRHIIAAAGIVLTAFLHAADAQQATVPSNEFNDALSAARFALVVDGVPIGVFTQMISVARLATGAVGQAITLGGGRTQHAEMWAWHEAVILGDMGAARKSASIVMYNASGTPVKRYNLTNAWPAKVSLDNGVGGQVRTVTVMLVYEEIRVLVE
jgi:hypothetical protein